jgi:hypothetical protein
VNENKEKQEGKAAVGEAWVSFQMPGG